MTLQELEKEKLRQEIANAKKRWYQKPENWNGFLPTLLAIGSIIYAITSGIIDVGLKRIENEKASIQNDKDRLQIDKERLDFEIYVQKLRKDSLSKKIDDQNIELTVSKDELVVIRTNIARAQSKINLLDKDASKYRTLREKTVRDILELRKIQSTFDAKFEKLKKQREIERTKEAKLTFTEMFDLNRKYKGDEVSDALDHFQDILSSLSQSVAPREYREFKLWMDTKKIAHSSLYSSPVKLN